MTPEQFLTKMQKDLDKRGADIWFKYKRDVPKEKTEASIVKALFANKRYGLVPTKKKTKNREINQQIGTSRSLQDMYLICKHYIPDTDIFKVSEVLKSYRNKGSLTWYFCVTFRRMMFELRYGYSDDPRIEDFGIL